MGWQMLLAALATFARVVVFTRDVNIPEIRAHLPADDSTRVILIGIDGGKVALWVKRSVPGGNYLYYFLWQRLASKAESDLDHVWDIGHHVTYAGDWLPTFLSRTQKPFIWGPVGGVAPTYWRLLRFAGARGLLGEAARLALVAPIRAIFGQRALRSASIVLAQNGAVERWARKYAKDVRVLPNPFISVAVGEWRGAGSTTVVGVGRLLPWKGWSIVLRAMARADGELRLQIFGGGPDLARLARLARKLGISDRVEFEGVVPRDAVLAAIKGARATVSASLRDSAGWGIAEAVTIGCPVVALGAAGVGTVLEQSGCVSIDPDSRDVVGQLRAALQTPPAAPRVERWTPPAQLALISKIYEDAQTVAGLER